MNQQLLVTVFLGTAICTVLGSCHRPWPQPAGRARVAATEAKLLHLEAALESYRLHAGFYPTEAQGLEALVKRPENAPQPRRWKQMFKQVPLDAWDNKFRYKYPGGKDPKRAEVISPGRDGKFGTEDDLSNQDDAEVEAE